MKTLLKKIFQPDGPRRASGCRKSTRYTIRHPQLQKFSIFPSEKIFKNRKLRFTKLQNFDLFDFLKNR